MRVLIAEDDIDLNEILVKKFRAEGFEADACFNGEEAVYFLQYGDYDAGILDIMMPVMDGLQALKMLRSRGNCTPVIFLTARDSISNKIEGLNLGASDYVVKPFSFEELTARIMAVVRTASGSASSVLKMEDLSLDMNSHIIKRAGNEIRLTGKEYRLLEYLFLNKNRILDREKIINHVWGFAYEGSTNIVDVYMKYLRTKIDDGYDTKLIHTVRGIGYTMRSDQR